MKRYIEILGTVSLDLSEGTVIIASEHFDKSGMYIVEDTSANVKHLVQVDVASEEVRFCMPLNPYKLLDNAIVSKNEIIKDYEVKLQETQEVAKQEIKKHEGYVSEQFVKDFATILLKR